MRYIAAEDVAKAKEMNLLTYLRNYEPQELVCVSGNTYCTREHDSLRISNGKWCWFSQGIGGRSALDYLIKVKGIPFTQAAEIILGREAEKPPVFYRQKERRRTELLMPELSETTEQVEKYLYRSLFPQLLINRFSSFCCPSLASTTYHSEPSWDTSIQRGLAPLSRRRKNISHVLPYFRAVFNMFD